MENPSYYAIIPANVRYSKITPNAKLLYGEITALSNKHGYCYASNAYFSNLYGVSKTSINNWINELIENKFISREIVYVENSKEVVNRYLRIVDHPIQENLGGSPKNLDHPIQENLEGSPKNLGYNNITLNNTYNITSNNPTGEGISNKNTNILENNIKSTPNPPRVSAPQVQSGSRLPNKVKAKLLDFDSNTRKVLENYCLFLIDTYNLPERSLLNRIDDVRIKARNVNSAIEAICNYNINGGYKTLYVPGNLSKIVAETVVISEEASDDDFVRDADGNIEEIW